jgi:hypothetical protein
MTRVAVGPVGGKMLLHMKRGENVTPQNGTGQSVFMEQLLTESGGKRF